MENTTVDEKPLRTDDPSARIWSVYVAEAEKHDRSLAESWKGDMDALLIFAGLFSAILTTFIIESYRTLSPDPTIVLLTQISQQLVALSNGTTVQVQQLGSEFQVPTSSLVCNTLWFLSLAFSLTSALWATLVQGWVRNYIQAIQRRPTLHKRARISAYLYQGLRKFRMIAIVELIPTLLHISLLLFFAGLVEFLRPVNSLISTLMLVLLIASGFLYGLITLLPIFYSDCPYQTPLSKGSWKVLRAIGLRNLRRYDYRGNLWSFRSMSEVSEIDAIGISVKRDERDLEAMRWTMESLKDDGELEPFVSFIPQVVSGIDYSAKTLLSKLLDHDDINVGLGYRIPRLLTSCVSGHLDPLVAAKRAETCLAAIWALSMMAIPDLPSPSYSPKSAVPFDENALRYIGDVKGEIPQVSQYADSALSAIARNLLDMFVDQVQAMEDMLLPLPWAGHAEEKRVTSGDRESLVRQSEHTIRRAKGQIEDLELRLTSTNALTSPPLYVMMESLRQYLAELVHTAAATSDTHLAQEGLAELQRFRRILHQAGFSLVIDYVATVLSSQSLPYEAFNTMRRLYLKISSSFCPTPDLQLRLVTQLDEALEQNPDRGTRLPISIINILLGLTRSLDDPSCIIKAQGIIRRHLVSSPLHDTARNTLEMLEEVLPIYTRSKPTLELFRSHLYADTRLERTPTLAI